MILRCWLLKYNHRNTLQHFVKKMQTLLKLIDVDNDMNKDLTCQFSFSLYDAVINFYCRL